MTTIGPDTKVKYLTNKDLLEEIHKSKLSYCEFVDPVYSSYDFIVHDVKKITKKRIEEARRKRIADKTAKMRKEQIAAGIKNPDIKIGLSDVLPDSIVIRVMTFDHIPLNDDKIHKAKTEADRHIKCNFPPFQHYIMREGELICVGKSHWIGGLENGYFSNSHGKMTAKLALMFMKLVERYGHRGNWRGYCVDETTEALTQRGWLTYDKINENDTIMSFNNGQNTWSSIKSIYRGEFDGLMHKLDVIGMDALITPGHKLITKNGLKPAELLLESDSIILMGQPESGAKVETYTNAFVELAGWIVTDGCYEKSDDKIKRIVIYQNSSPKADRIRDCLNTLEYKFTESLRGNNISFAISRNDSRKIYNILPIKDVSMTFILALTSAQRELLVNTLVAGDGWITHNKYRHYVQKNKDSVDLFQALCAINGTKTNSHYVDNHKSFGKPVTYYNINLFSPRKNKTKVECIEFHGGKRNGRGSKGTGKHTHPNVPTTYYKGMVWCPETEYGSFMARRNGKVYLTGNTYLEEMKSQALLQLSQIGLQFDESRSEVPNPFAYYTAALANSFTRILNIEKKNQNIRDDLLTMHGAMPSYSRQVDDDMKRLMRNKVIPTSPEKT
jgi:hypothetical protein